MGFVNRDDGITKQDPAAAERRGKDDAPRGFRAVWFGQKKTLLLFYATLFFLTYYILSVCGRRGYS
jgi:hypothetical protein